jgi:hypothetical protein
LYVGTGLGIVDLVCELFCVCEDCAGDSKCMLKFMMCMCVGLEIGHLCWKLFSYDGCGLGVGHVFGKLVCVHCCWAGDWTFTLEIIVKCWDWTDDLTFMMDVVFMV